MNYRQQVYLAKDIIES